MGALAQVKYACAAGMCGGGSGWCVRVHVVCLCLVCLCDCALSVCVCACPSLSVRLCLSVSVCLSLSVCLFLSVSVCLTPCDCVHGDRVCGVCAVTWRGVCVFVCVCVFRVRSRRTEYFSFSVRKNRNHVWTKG